MEGRGAAGDSSPARLPERSRRSPLHMSCVTERQGGPRRLRLARKPQTNGPGLPSPPCPALPSPRLPQLKLHQQGPAGGRGACLGGRGEVESLLCLPAVPQALRGPSEPVSSSGGQGYMSADLPPSPSGPSGPSASRGTPPRRPVPVSPRPSVLTLLSSPTGLWMGQRRIFLYLLFSADNSGSLLFTFEVDTAIL